MCSKITEGKNPKRKIINIVLIGLIIVIIIISVVCCCYFELVANGTKNSQKSTRSHGETEESKLRESIRRGAIKGADLMMKNKDIPELTQILKGIEDNLEDLEWEVDRKVCESLLDRKKILLANLRQEAMNWQPVIHLVPAIVNPLYDNLSMRVDALAEEIVEIRTKLATQRN